MKAHFIAFALATTMLAACSETQSVEEAPAYSERQYMQAINDVARLDDQEDDARRKPGALLAFAQIDKGEVVGDWVMGGGYVTKLLATAVGAKGKVYAFQPSEFIAFIPTLADDQDAAIAPYTNDEGEPVRVFPLRGPMAEPGWPEPLDTIITVQNYHDLLIEAVPDGSFEKGSKMLFDALKPGGTLVVVDHVAAEGAGAEVAETLHRMDTDLALKALTDAGFVLEEESDLYANPDDNHESSVFDEAIRGKTDQFAWRLRKPA